MVARKNIIEKVKIGVNTPSHENGMQLKDDLDAFFKEKVFPEMDKYFNSIQKNHSQIIRIENISLEINIEEKDSLIEIKSLIMNELIKIIKEEDLIKNNSENFQIITSEQNVAEAFFYFLRNGSYPWWFEEKANFWDGFLEKIQFKKEISEKLKALFSIAEIRKRLIFQFDDAQIFQIVFSVLNQNKKSELKIDIPQNYRFQFWETILHYSIFKNEMEIIEILQNTPIEQVERILKMAKGNFNVTIPLKNKGFSKKIDSEQSNKDAKSLEKMKNMEITEQNPTNIKEGVFIKNVGLVLLHPFFKMFFEKLDFLSGKNIKPDKIDEAIHVLHYLSTGKKQAYENELLIEKFICNVPFHQPINRHIILTKDQKIACEVLLQAVLEHWTALKSSSTEIIQNEFLQREGKLIISEEKQTLIVERKAQDILLDKLPWNIHLIKIPWREKILFVEW